MQSRDSDGIWHRKICHANNEKWETTNDGKNRTTESRNITMLQESETYNYLGILKADAIELEEIEKIQKRISREW